ncbi:MAG: protein kinase [Deltaproteobacteria bacterium]|nr:protein kinase [Deltaproteobacteria bacterium]
MPKVSKLETQSFYRGPGSRGKFAKCNLYMEWDNQCLQYRETLIWKKLFFNKVVNWEAKPGGYRGTFIDTRYPPSIVLRTASGTGTEEREFAIRHLEFDNWLYWIIRSLLKYSKAPIPDEQLSGLSSKHKAKVLTRRDMSAFDQSHEVFITILEKLSKETDKSVLGTDQKTFAKSSQDIPKMKFGALKTYVEDGTTTGGIAYGKVGKKIGTGGSDAVIFEIQKLLEPVLIKNTAGAGYTIVRPAEPMIVKVPKYSKDDPTSLKGVIKEARILAALGRHPNIVGLIDAHVHGVNRIYLFLEKGYEDLKSCITKKLSLSPPQIRKYAMGILAGIDHMHQRRVYHLDMKPENVILCQADTPKIIDFGLSKTRIIDSKEDMFDETWYLYGTKEYMPPESWNIGAILKETDLIKRDSFAVGMTIFNALLCPYCGWKAFEVKAGLGESPDIVLQRSHHLMKLVRDAANRKKLTSDGLLILADAASGLIEDKPEIRLTCGQALEFLKADRKQLRQEHTSNRSDVLTAKKEYNYLRDQLKKSGD